MEETSIKECDKKTTVSMFNLEQMKNRIEAMNKQHHIEILKILKKYPSIKLNENKSGIFVNLSFLSKETIEEISKYIEYISDQESSIQQLETQKEEFKNTFFGESIPSSTLDKRQYGFI
jgi:hypothetical protein